MNKIWIVPASDKIATKNIPLSLADGFPSSIKDKIEDKGFKYDFAWGARLGTGKNKNHHKKMKKGDLCLFYTADQQALDETKKAYRWLAYIEDTTDDSELAEAIWHPGKNGEKFSLIYFITKPIKIYLETGQLGKLLTHNGHYFYAPPKGLSEIKQPESLNYIQDTYGSIDEFTNHILKNFALEAPDEEIYPDFYTPPPTLSLKKDSYTFSNQLLKLNFKNGTKERKAAYSVRRSTESKKIGDEAEIFVYNLLKSGDVEGVRKETVKNVASEKVGWDLQYEDTLGNFIKVEVKGTVGKQFLNFEITQNELEKLTDPANHYHIYLVAGCRTNRKELQVIENIRELINLGQVTYTPLTYRIELIGQSV